MRIIVASDSVSSSVDDLLDVKKKSDFRNYTDEAPTQNRVSKFYQDNRKHQTLEAVLEKKETILKLDKKLMSVWEAAELLDTLVDQSDPDTENGQIIHLLQTAEAIRRQYPGEEYDWFHLTGLIHDLGKVLSHPDVYDLPQHFVVGDTFPVGCAFEESNVYHHFFEENPNNKDPRMMSKLGIYHEGIGLDKVHFSFGHDEYMYQVCVQNGSTLPEQALYIIRYHSFYPWHTHNSYTYLTNEKDREMLSWVKEFQRFDLYSKLPEKPNLDEIIPYYKSLIAKYFPEKLRW
uniref:Inositol oxygenase n=1 Tax=Hordeum vulgare subsp. vulgare TaxID=112509 RepID=F2DSY0_HORVV|nr:predicted protein [Hordeum vulgare subsp. vulgare]